MVLREYQNKTIELVKHKIRSGNKRILVTLPTGSGKSIIMAHIAKACVEKGNKCLALMHRRQLVEQLTFNFSLLGISSSIVMAGMDTDLEASCKIATIQTYSRRIKLKEDYLIDGEHVYPWFHDADVVFCDESHRSLSKTFQDVLGKYSDKIVIGFTATPSLSSGVAMGEFYDTLIQPITVRELIECGALVSSACYGLSSPDLSKIKIVAGDYDKTGLDTAMNNQKLIGDVVENWSKIAFGKRTIVFAVNVKHSIALEKEFRKYGIAAEHLDAHSSDEKRADVLRRFKTGETTVLTNVDLYTEGTDIPEIECVCLARATKSIGRYLQMVGRGARPSPGKENFLILDHGKNINEHGFYEDDIEWTLAGKKIKYHKKRKTVKEKHMMSCSVCSCLFYGHQCPECLTVIENYGKKIEAIEAELKRLKEDKKPKEKFNFDDKKRWYGMFLSEQIKYGKSDKWVLAQYKSKFGVWPRGMENVIPEEANNVVKSWIISQRIRWIKRKQKEERLASEQRSGCREVEQCSIFA